MDKLTGSRFSTNLELLFNKLIFIKYAIKVLDE